jgi:undecaprenyl-diphosphatase
MANAGVLWYDGHTTQTGGFSMDILKALASLRNPVLDKLMQGVTYLGEELVFMAVALILFWCVDKWKGYFILAVGFIGTILNQFLKLAFRVPRPWVRDPSFQIVESARNGAGGYSFPSGHTQNAVGTFGGIARGTKKTWLRVVLIVLSCLIAFSRMYLGVHYPSDILCGAMLGIVFAIIIFFLYKKAAKRLALPPYRDIYVSKEMFAIPVIYLLTVVVMLLLSL